MMSPPVARLAILALVCATGWGLYLAIEAFVLLPLRQQEQRTADLRSELTSLIERTGKAKSDLDRRAREDAATPPVRLTMTSPNLEATSVAMQESTRNALARSGGVPITSQSSAEASVGAGTVTILVRARFSELGLLSFVQAMESSDPPMLVDSFELSTLPGVAETPLEFTGTFLGFHTDAL